VSRAPVLVRDAVSSDASVLCLLWQELLVAPGPDISGGSAEQAVVTSIARATQDPSSRILVAETDGDVVGCAYLRTGHVSPVHEESVVHVSHLQVLPDAVAGVDRALVEAALSWAEHRGVDTVVAATSATDRDANRFFARLGLAQVAVLRGASVCALRARLPHDPAAPARAAARGQRSVGQVVAARRSQRRAATRQLLL
jgi:N-acetylglutamate synthase-like GNAT family acetyltransferase